MDAIRRIIAQIQTQLAGLAATQKLLIGSLCVIAVMVLFLVSQYAGGTKWVELMPGVSGSDQQKAVMFLTSNGIDHEVGAGGQVMVRPAQQMMVLGQLSQKRMMPGDTTLMFSNLADKQSPFQSKGQQESMRTLALMGELANVLSNWDWIDSAEVIINQVKPTGLGAVYQRSTASVSVRTGGGSMSQQMADTVAYFVAGAVANLRAEDVIVADVVRGRRFKARADDDAFAIGYTEHARVCEQAVRSKLEHHLSMIPGVIVSVTAIVDSSKTVETDRVVHPKGKGSEQIELSERTTSDQSENMQAAHEPGVGANTGMDLDQGSANGSKTSGKTGDTAYGVEFGIKQTSSTHAPGRPEKVNVSISVPREWVESIARMQAGLDEEADVPAADLDTARVAEEQRVADMLMPLVQASADNGQFEEGVVHVSMIPVRLPGFAFLGNGSGGPMAGAGGGSGGLGGLLGGSMISTVLLGGLGVVSIGMMFMMVRKATKVQVLPSAEEVIGLPPALAGGDDLVGEAGEGELPMTGIEIDDELMHTRKIAEEIEALVSGNPESAVSVFNSWVGTDED